MQERFNEEEKKRDEVDERLTRLIANIERDESRVIDVERRRPTVPVGHYSDPSFSASNGMVTKSTEVKAKDGSISRVINIGVPSEHQFADPDSKA
mmetsp:Transcript_18356/g.31385  ORF Transcript_18356/g.31385 Transcript_18356/m.31385 type:complete len:95 (-) Transcript_18356:841-1125(-)